MLFRSIHHHYSNDKFIPAFDKAYFRDLAANCGEAAFPVQEGQSREEFLAWVEDLIFNPEIAPKRISLDSSKDLVTSSACNFYEGVTEEEVDAFYNAFSMPDPDRPVSLGLNSKVVKKDGKVTEQVYTTEGLYGPALKQVVYWLEKAVSVAETENQRLGLQKLIAYYNTGDLKI